jgi:hypothetical protein
VLPTPWMEVMLNLDNLSQLITAVLRLYRIHHPRDGVQPQQRERGAPGPAADATPATLESLASAHTHTGGGLAR